MNYSINVTNAALDDLQNGLDFYNSRLENLGFRFADEVDIASMEILKMPSSFGYRYKGLRGK